MPRGHPIDPKDLKYLKKNYHKMNKELLAHNLGWTMKSLYNAAFEHNIAKRHKRITQTMIDTLLNEYDGLPCNHASELLGISEYMVKKIREGRYKLEEEDND